jgi:hypothetical protein
MHSLNFVFAWYSRCMTVALTHPDLWETCKQQAVEAIGSFNNRAMQHAIAAYKAAGGDYVPKTPEQLRDEPSNIGQHKHKRAAQAKLAQ